MEKNIRRTIEFSGRRAIMKPVGGGNGLYEIWDTNPPIEFNVSKQFFNFKGISYYLVSVIEKN